MLRLMWRRGAAIREYGVLVMLTVGAFGCGVSDEGSLPPNIPDPATLKNPAGALARYLGTHALLGGALDRVITASGIISDELAALPTPFGVSGTAFAAADARVDLTYLSGLSWNLLHKLRAQAREARGFLASYGPSDSTLALQGAMFAYEGYANIYLADLYCSGIPLSTVNFDGGYTLAPASTTAEVYDSAIGLFESALAISGDSADFQNLAAVGKARALLALGRYAAAATAVAGVPDTFAFHALYTHPVTFSLEQSGTAAESALLWMFASHFTRAAGVPSLADNEGLNGIDYRSSQDPRSSFTRLDGADPRGNTMYFPAKYTADLGFPGLPRSLSSSDSFVVASGIEARLIEAEAALQANPGDGQWLAILNHLRQTAWMTIVADTVSDPWTPGPLGDLADPGTDPARFDLMFRERALWLFMTGHRQGDLRRLLRQHRDRAVNEVYPAGPYSGGSGISNYGDQIVIPAPESEGQLNANYTGCIDRNA